VFRRAQAWCLKRIARAGILEALLSQISTNVIPADGNRSRPVLCFFRRSGSECVSIQGNLSKGAARDLDERRKALFAGSSGAGF
jgi:hypothetical protein